MAVNVEFVKRHEPFWRLAAAFGCHFANRAVATALNGKFRLIPYGQVFSSRYTFDFGGI